MSINCLCESLVKPKLWCTPPAGVSDSVWERKLQATEAYIASVVCDKGYRFLHNLVTPVDKGVFSGQEVKIGDAFIVPGGWSIAIRDARYPDAFDFVVMENLDAFWSFTREYLDIVCEASSSSDCDFDSVSVGTWSVTKGKTRSSLEKFLDKYRCRNPYLA